MAEPADGFAKAVHVHARLAFRAPFEWRLSTESLEVGEDLLCC
jgi:hypothetical protein